MANGEGLDSIDKIWHGYDAHEDKDGVIAREKQAATNIIMAGALRGLPCKRVSEKVSALERGAVRTKTVLGVIIVLWVIATTLLAIFWK